MAHAPAVAGRHQVRDLNDALRRSFSGGRVVITAGIAALPESSCTAILAAVRGFNPFDSNNDPHGEHDFGAVTVGAVQARRIDLLFEWPLDTDGRRAVVVVEAKLDAAVSQGQLSAYRAEVRRRARGGPVGLVLLTGWADTGLPPEKWSSLRYGFEPCGGCHHGTEEAYG